MRRHCEPEDARGMVRNKQRIDIQRTYFFLVIHFLIRRSTCGDVCYFLALHIHRPRSSFGVSVVVSTALNHCNDQTCPSTRVRVCAKSLRQTMLATEEVRRDSCACALKIVRRRANGQLTDAVRQMRTSCRFPYHTLTSVRGIPSFVDQHLQHFTPRWVNVP